MQSTGTATELGRLSTLLPYLPDGIAGTKVTLLWPLLDRPHRLTGSPPGQARGVHRRPAGPLGVPGRPAGPAARRGGRGHRPGPAHPGGRPGDDRGAGPDDRAGRLPGDDLAEDDRGRHRRGGRRGSGWPGCARSRRSTCWSRRRTRTPTWSRWSAAATRRSASSRRPTWTRPPGCSACSRRPRCPGRRTAQLTDTALDDVVAQGASAVVLDPTALPRARPSRGGRTPSGVSPLPALSGQAARAGVRPGGAAAARPGRGRAPGGSAAGRAAAAGRAGDDHRRGAERQPDASCWPRPAGGTPPAGYARALAADVGRIPWLTEVDALQAAGAPSRSTAARWPTPPRPPAARSRRRRSARWAPCRLRWTTSARRWTTRTPGRGARPVRGRGAPGRLVGLAGLGRRPGTRT